MLSGVDLEVDTGAHVALMGASGEGKSTLLTLLGGLEPAQSGEVVVAGQDLRKLGRSEMAAFRSRTVGFVFQHFGLLEALTAFANIELPLSIARRPRLERERRVRELLDEVGLSDRARHLPGRLSGGEQQRVAVARAVANEPALILADEPTGNLDEANADRVLGLLESSRRDRGCTLVVVTHDRNVARRADVVFRLSDGKLSAA